MSEPVQEFAVIEQHTPTIAPLENPAAFVQGYVAVADTLSRVVRDKNLFKRIGDKDHVLVEGWTLLGSMLGVFPVTVWSRPVDDHNGEPNGWEARVEARTRDGAVIGAAEAECLRSERTWAGREDYALRSMAQTRATSKALRQPLGFVMTLAGFNPTPAEEMPRDEPQTVVGGEWVIPFGKHSGKRLADVPADYVDWLNLNAKDASVRAQVEAYLVERDVPADASAYYNPDEVAEAGEIPF
jgi:hypothetical protein